MPLDSTSYSWPQQLILFVTLPASTVIHGYYKSSPRPIYIHVPMIKKKSL